jgi:hypothetical protein
MAWIYMSKKEGAEIREAIREIERSPSDRAAAIIAGAFVEDHLTTAIQVRMHQDRKILQDIFRPSGPLGNFGTKIALAFLMGIYSGKARRELDTIRVIRNEFAHKLASRDFSNQRIAALTNGLKLVDTTGYTIRYGAKGTSIDIFPIKRDVEPFGPRARFVATCQLFLAMLTSLPITEPPSPNF